MTSHDNSIPHFNFKHDYFKNSLFSSIILKWNNLDSNITNSKNLVLSKKRILAFLKISANSTFHFHNL